VYEVWEIKPKEFGMKHADMCCILRQKSSSELRFSLVRSYLDTVKTIFEVSFTEWVIVYQCNNLTAESQLATPLTVQSAVSLSSSR
jgi:hypothetical protein